MTRHDLAKKLLGPRYDEEIFEITFWGWLATSLLLVLFWVALDLFKDSLFFVFDHSPLVQHVMHWFWS